MSNHACGSLRRSGATDCAMKVHFGDVGCMAMIAFSERALYEFRACTEGPEAARAALDRARAWVPSRGRPQPQSKGEKQAAKKRRIKIESRTAEGREPIIAFTPAQSPQTPPIAGTTFAAMLAQFGPPGTEGERTYLWIKGSHRRFRRTSRRLQPPTPGPEE